MDTNDPIICTATGFAQGLAGTGLYVQVRNASTDEIVYPPESDPDYPYTLDGIAARTPPELGYRATIPTIDGGWEYGVEYRPVWTDGIQVVEDDLTFTVSASPAPSDVLALVNGYLNRDGDADDYDLALKASAIEIALSLIEGEIGTTYYTRQRTDKVIVSSGSQRFPVPVYSPVQEVLSLTGPDATVIDPDTVEIVGRRLVAPDVSWPAGTYTVTYTYGHGSPPLDLAQAIALAAADALKDGPASDRGYAMSDDVGVVRLLTAGVSGAAVSIPEVQAAIYRHRVRQVGGF